MACEGIYADVQSGEDGLTDEIEEQRAEKTQEETENKEEVVDKGKFLWMLKTKYVKILRFNSSANVVPFGENSSLVPFISINMGAQSGHFLLFFNIDYLRRGATSINLGACPDLL